MNPELRILIDEATTTATRKGQIRVQRLLSLLDLTPPCSADAVARFVEEELADQRARGCVRCGEIAGLEQASGLLRESNDSFPVAALQALKVDGVDAAAALKEVIERYLAFTRRLRWLLQPSTFEEVQQLDPVKDATQIYHFISYEFRAEQKIFAVLFETRPVMIPYSAMMFHSTGEFTMRAFKRINDTVMFFSNMMEWGLDSKRGREAIARVNSIHGRYAIGNDNFRFILGGIMFVPQIWNERLGWRRFTDIERLGWFHAFQQMGRAMNILGIADNYDDERAWWDQTSRSAGESSPVGLKTFVEIAVQVMQTYPPDLRRPLLTAILVGMDDTYREMLGVPPPPPDVAEAVRGALFAIGKTSSALPHVPWIRSVQTFPMYSKLDDVGVNQRSAFLPRQEGSGFESESARLRENDGRPTGQHPTEGPTAVRQEVLPEVSMEEIARHTDDAHAWIAVHGYVYDVGRFLFEHPGGDRVLRPWFGKDATATFDRIGHSNGALVLMANFRVARVAGADPKELEASTAPGKRIHSGRRDGRDKKYTRKDWDSILDTFVHLTSSYEDKVMKGERRSDMFPIDIPMDPRTQARLKQTANADDGTHS